MSDILHKMSCTSCSGNVEFTEESEGATVPCPHCGNNLFLYRPQVRAVKTEPQAAAIQPQPSSETKYKTFAEVPWFRREPGAMAILLIFLCPPFLLALCIIALTGNIYRNAHDKNGKLMTWGIGNKIAAAIILAIQLVVMIASFNSK